VATAYIGLGSNLDDPSKQIERALLAVAKWPGIELRKTSRLFQSTPWGVSDQPDFVNAAAEIQTELSPRELLQALLDIERQFGRIRDSTRWGPRILDLDLLAYADFVLDEPGLHLPHPHAHERAFVLLPLADIAPGLVIPGHGSVAALLQNLSTESCMQISSS
jgi:2-amino-4-hydroxy-6-hydroxymethyldihydropteridine diphosphokinase